jgi:hypothetical protein
MHVLTSVPIHPDPSLRTMITFDPHGPGDPVLSKSPEAKHRVR